jgi:hypothetical protein
MPQAICPLGKSPLDPLYRKLDKPQNQSGRRGDEKIIPRTLTRLDRRSQTLYQLRYPRLIRAGTSPSNISFARHELLCGKINEETRIVPLERYI